MAFVEFVFGFAVFWFFIKDIKRQQHQQCLIFLVWYGWLVVVVIVVGCFGWCNIYSCCFMICLFFEFTWTRRISVMEQHKEHIQVNNLFLICWFLDRFFQKIKKCEKKKNFCLIICIRILMIKLDCIKNNKRVVILSGFFGLSV